MIAVLVILLLAAAAAPAMAQSDAGAPDASVARLQARQAAIAARGDVDAAIKGRIDETYKRAIGELERAARLRKDEEALRTALAGAARDVAQLERRLDEAERRGARPDSLAAVDTRSVDELVQRVTTARLEADDARYALDALARAVAEVARRPDAARRERELAREALQRVRSERRGTARPSLLEEADRQLALARTTALQTELDWLDREAAYQPDLLRITRLEQALARVELARKGAVLEAWVDALIGRLRTDAERSRAEAERVGATPAGASATVRALTARSAALSAELVEDTVRFREALHAQARVRAAAVELEAYQQRLESVVTGRRLGTEVAQTLLDRLWTLPTARQHARARAERDSVSDQTADANMRVGRELRQLADLPAVLAAALRAAEAEAPAAGRGALDAALREQLTTQRTLLTRLDEGQRAILQALREAEQSATEFAERVAAMRAEVIRLLFWVPLDPVGPQAFTRLAPALGWTFSAGNWAAAYRTLAKEAARRPALTALVLLLAGTSLALRGSWKRRIPALAPAVVSVEKYGIGHVLLALLLTGLLALPGALLLWAAGVALTNDPDAPAFSLALGPALEFVALTLFALSGLVWLCDARGVAVNHFQWPTTAMAPLQRSFRAISRLLVPLMFVVVVNTWHAPQGNQGSLGRIAFIILVLALSGLMWRLFHRSSPVTGALLAAGSRGWIGPLRPLWYGFLVLAPIAFAVMSAVGFHLAALSLFVLFRQTIQVGAAAVMLYGVVAVWMLLQEARLARQRAPVAGVPAAITFTALGSQRRQLLSLLITAFLAAGLWVIWHDALALDALGDIGLWQYADTIDGQSTTRTVTLGALALAMLVLTATFVVVRAIGAVLDIVLLQRLEIDKDAAYALTTITRYLLVAAGVIGATSILHIGWDKVQWLVAALGVGLGFGLQEIVANFVSGLIVLGERPVRIGDVVTVGDITGTVARLRARATVVTDFDNKEIMIPNKAFITERVVNWTLSSQTTRLLISVGVAYGTDVEQARSVMLAAVRAIPDVLAQPTPSVFFVGFGDSALNFEIRAFVDAFDKRLRVRHEIHVAVERTLRAAGIEIPFPQRDVRIRSAEGMPPVTPPHVAGPTAGDDPRRGA